MHFQRPGSREALVALWEGAGTGGVVGTSVIFLHDRVWLPLSPAAVVHQMGLQVPLAPKPDPTSLTRKYVLWGDKRRTILGDILHFNYAYKPNVWKLHTCVHTNHHTPTVLTLSVKTLFLKSSVAAINRCFYHWVGALTQGQTRTMDHLLAEASLLS